MTTNVKTNKIFDSSLTDYSNTVIGGTYTSDTITIGSSDPTYTNWGTASIGVMDWSNISINGTSNSSITRSGLMELHGDNADIRINGRSLMSAIDALEQRLNILVPNPELEKEWDELKQLGDLYRELEKKCKEKGEMWKKLKQMPPEQG